jgi:Arc/MetJ-type ribon-helix-helix transcriptional regulator
MTVQIKPEDELLIQRLIDAGMFSSPEDVVHHALQTFELERQIAAHRQAGDGRIGLSQ